MKPQKHANIPIFIPHLGCPNNCVFCNQRSISGHLDFDAETVRDEIENALATIGERDADLRETLIDFLTGYDNEQYFTDVIKVEGARFVECTLDDYAPIITLNKNINAE